MGVRLSKKFGVNPAIPLCFFCNKPKNEVILAGQLANDAEAPRHAVWDKHPCDECAGWMSQGVLFISIKDDEPQSDNPFRTGRWCVIKTEAVERLPIDDETREHILAKRVAFVEEKVWAEFGLPTGDVNNAD